VSTYLSKRNLILTGILLCTLYFLWHNHPFPLDDGAISKQEASEAALQYLGLEEATVQTAVTYDADQPIIAYLQKEKLLDSYIAKHELAAPLDYYRVEILQEDAVRYEVLVHRYEGIVAGWSKTLAAPLAGGPSDVRTARQAADEYLSTQRPGDLTEADITVQEHPDGSYTFYYEQRDEEIGEAHRIAIVSVAGASVISYHSSFTPPDHFAQWLDQQDRRSATFTTFTLWMSVAMAAVALTLAIQYKQAIRWTDGLVLIGITIIIETIYYVNTIPSDVSLLALQQAGPWMFIFDLLFGLVLTTIFGLTIYMPYLGGRAMLIYEGKQHLLTHTKRAEWQSAVIRSYGLALFILALQTMIFSVAESSFHVWWIPDPQLSTDNMLWPLLMPLTAWAAAISEEIIYRLFAVTILRKLLRSNLAAILVSSMIWALGHTAYPVYPVYTRFVEVTIIGIVFGYIFIKFGFATAVFTHAVIDSILMGFDVASVGTYGVLVAVIYIAAPLLIGWVISWRSSSRPIDRGSTGRLLPPDLSHRST